MLLLNVLAAPNLGGTEVLCRDMVRVFSNEKGIEPRICCLFPGDAGMLASLSEAAGCPVPVCAITSGESRVRYLAVFWRLCRQMRADAMIVHFFGVDAVLMSLIARLCGVKAITVVAGNPAPDVGADLLRALKWGLSLFAFRVLRVPVVSVSAWVERSLLRIARLPSASCVIHNGTDFDRIAHEAAEARSARQDADVFVMGAVGRLEKIKDIATSLRALALFKAARPNARWRFEIVGDGPDRLALEDLSNHLGLGDAIAFRGARRDVYRLFGSWDAFLFSTTRDEGFGIVLVEAMAAGLEILASDVPACREVLRGGELGGLFPAGEAEMLALHIGAMYDAFEATRAASRGRGFYDISVCASKHLALIRNLAAAYD